MLVRYDKIKKRRSNYEKRFTEEQIIKILKSHEAGQKTSDIVREYNISEQTFYRWKSK
ncbi:transposase [Fusibacter bizertensis]